MFKLFQNIVGNDSEKSNVQKNKSDLAKALVSSNPETNALSLSNNSSSLAQRNDSSWQQGSIQESIQFYDRAIRENSDPQEAYRDLCSHFKQQQSVANGYKTLAESLRRKGRNEEAATCYRQAIVIQAIINEAEDRYGNLGDNGSIIDTSNSFDLIDDAFSFRSSIQSSLSTSSQNLLQIQLPSNYVIEESLAHNGEDLNCFRAATIEWEAAQICMQKALDSYDREEWAEVASACEQATQIAPSMAEAYKIWGNALQRLNQTAEAMECYRKVVEIQPDLAEVYFGIAELYSQQQKWQPASGYYQKAIIIKPEFARAYNSLAYAWEQSGHPDKAKICKDRAQEIGGNLSLLPSLKNNQQKNVEEITNSANETDPDKEILVTNFHHLGQRSEQQQRWQEASSYYRKALELNLSNQQKLIPANVSHNQQNITKLVHQDNESLIEASVVKTTPESTQNNLVNSSSDEEKKGSQNSNFDQEILEYLQVTKSQPDSILNHLALGDLYVKQKKWQSAISSYSKAIRINPQEPIAHFKLAQIFDKVGNHTSYIDHSYIAYCLKPELGSADNHFELGNSLSDLGHFNKAIVCHQQAIKLQPHFIEAHKALGSLWIKLRKYNQAKVCYKSAIEQNPRNVDFYIALGDLVVKDKNWEVAVNIFRKVLQIQPKCSEASQKLNYSLSQKLQSDLAKKYQKVG